VPKNITAYMFFIKCSTLYSPVPQCTHLVVMDIMERSLLLMPLLTTWELTREERVDGGGAFIL